MKSTVSTVILSILLIGIPLITGCGGGSGNTQPNMIGPTAVLNGSTLASAKSHWVAGGCGVQVELATDGGFVSVVTDTSGTTSSGVATWSASGSSGLVTTFNGGLGGFFWVASLTNIAGSTASSTFTAGTTVEDGSGTQQHLGNCTFSLQQGTIPRSDVSSPI